jgi:predicted transporter
MYEINTSIPTPASCLRQSRLFNYLVVSATLVSATLFTLGHMIADKKLAFLPIAMSLPPVMLCLALSIFVYASIAHHPNLTVRHYNKWAGYRYYAIVGTLTIFSSDLARLPTGWPGVYVLMVLVLVPWSLYDIWKAGREDWKEIDVDTYG